MIPEDEIRRRLGEAEFYRLGNVLLGLEQPQWLIGYIEYLKDRLSEDYIWRTYPAW